MTPTRIRPYYLLPVIGFGIILLLAACQSNRSNIPHGVSSAEPEQSVSTTAGSVASPAQTGQVVQDTSVLNLNDPLTGLSTLNSYHLTYTSTVNGNQNGQVIESNLSIDGSQNGAYQSELVQQTSTGNQPVYLDMVKLNGTKYTQQTTAGACRTSASAESLISGQTIKLPPVFNAELVGQETIDNTPSKHYQFDEKSVAWQAGQNGKAQGDVWIAHPGDYVMKYKLSIQYSSGDFQGSRNWSYELKDINTGTSISLPQGCIALITDIPLMDGAAEAVQRPGFQKYTISSSLDQVISFYKNQLATSGWTLLPGIEPEGGKQTLVFTQPQTGGGGRFAVIQMAESNGQTAVVVQAANTKKAITLDATPGPETVVPNENPTETPESGGKGGTPSATVNIPDDFPNYPGANILFQNDQMMTMQTGDTPDIVLTFYKQGMDRIGFTLDNSMTINGITTETWTRDQLQIQMVIMQQGNITNITVSAEAK